MVKEMDGKKMNEEKITLESLNGRIQSIFNILYKMDDKLNSLLEETRVDEEELDEITYD